MKHTDCVSVYGYDKYLPQPPARGTLFRQPPLELAPQPMLSMFSAKLDNGQTHEKGTRTALVDETKDGGADTVATILDASSLANCAVVSDGVSPPSVICNPKNVNGKILATVYPTNVTCDWVTPPVYDARSMPSILAIDVPNLPPAVYVEAMETIINDKRFKMYSTVYSRLVAIWMTFAIVLLVAVLLLQSRGGWPVMVFSIVWIVAMFVGIYVCAILRRQIRIGLRHCVEQANKVLIPHHLLIGIEDKGQLSCHKMTLHFMRYNASECTCDVARQIRVQRTGGCLFGSTTDQTSIEDNEKEAFDLIIKYSHGFVKSTVKHRLALPSKPTHGASDFLPKHCRAQLCLCQYIDEKKFRAKPKKWYENLNFLCYAPEGDQTAPPPFF